MSRGCLPAPPVHDLDESKEFLLRQFLLYKLGTKTNPVLSSSVKNVSSLAPDQQRAINVVARETILTGVQIVLVDQAFPCFW